MLTRNNRLIAYTEVGPSCLPAESHVPVDGEKRPKIEKSDSRQFNYPIPNATANTNLNYAPKVLNHNTRVSYVGLLTFGLINLRRFGRLPYAPATVG